MHKINDIGHLRAVPLFIQLCLSVLGISVLGASVLGGLVLDIRILNLTRQWWQFCGVKSRQRGSCQTAKGQKSQGCPHGLPIGQKCLCVPLMESNQLVRRIGYLNTEKLFPK